MIDTDGKQYGCQTYHQKCDHSKSMIA